MSAAARVVLAHEALALSRRSPDRVLLRRMVRRLKPKVGVGKPPKPKSRWCVRGHQDPDTEYTTCVEMITVTNSCPEIFSFVSAFFRTDVVCGLISLRITDIGF